MQHLSHVRDGASMIEVVLAIGLLAIFASTLFAYIGTQLLTASGSRQSLAAIEQAQEGLEAVRTIRDSGWANLTTGSHGLSLATSTWAFQGVSDSTDGFTRVLTVTDLSASEKQVVSTVSWTDAQERARSTSLTTTLSDWRNVVPPPLLSGDWTEPRILSNPMFDIGLNVVGTGVRVRDDFVYMSGTGAANDFFVVNVSDPSHPAKAGTNSYISYNSGGSNELDIEGNFAYVANNTSSNQLEVINISTPAAPYAIKNFTLTGNTHVALSIAVTGTIALVGTVSDSHQELFVLDVTDPATPVIKGKVEVGGSVNGINIVGNHAFLATSNTSKEFMVIDITNPNVPVIKANINLPGSNIAKTVYVNPLDHRAYIGRAKSSSGSTPELNVYDVTNPDAPVFLASKEISAGLYTVYAADNLLFIGTDVSSSGIQVYDVSNLPTFTVYGSSLNAWIVNDIDFENNVFYGSIQGVTEELVTFSSSP